ncbi:MAG: valine--tRNA ligase [Bdellovibrionota bacterium]
MMSDKSASRLLSSLEKNFDPTQIEDHLYQEWETKNYFRASTDATKPNYCIDLPPPNVTGSLHMGHALNHCIQDVLVRYKRMDGYNAAWIPGTDHAGIATQSVVERNLAKEGKTRLGMGREKFEQEVWKWKEEYGGTIVRQIRKMGSSCDWSRERFTLDEGFTKAVRHAFVTLYQEKLIYRSSYLVNWDTALQTAVSDLEVEYKDVEGQLYHFVYPIEGSDKGIEVATTRPETMLGDVAVAVHPEDGRYQHLIGKKILHPFLNRRFPIIGDDQVKMEFGTGAVKITPAHDPNDYQMGIRHQLENISVIEKNGAMSSDAGQFAGMDRFEARKQVIAALKDKGLFVKQQKHSHAVGHSQRSGTIIEPLISEQWFVKTTELAKPAIEAVTSGQTKFVPSNWTKTYLQWMENINDWCISRQLWWGHRIPVWYCQDCSAMTCSIEDPSQCESCNKTNIVQDPDVLDTWFSSGLWPFGTLGWPEQTKDLKFFYPTTTLVTAFDIIFFWVARMMMMSMKFMNKAPFETVHIHALVRDEHGQKMSKSKGNVIDPLEMVQTYGADAFRFSLMAFSVQGRDVSISKDRIEGYRNFMNKLWNATRFALQALPSSFQYDPNYSYTNLSDQWIVGRLNKAIKNIRESLDSFRFNDYAHHIYQFAWHEVCDWYIELSKTHLYGNDEKAKESAAQCLIYVLDQTMKLLHPASPFITEKLWQTLPIEHETASIMLSTYPTSSSAVTDPSVEHHMAAVQEIINAVRTIRSENTIAPKVPLTCIILPIETQHETIELSGYSTYIASLANIDQMHWEDLTLDGPLAVSRGTYFHIKIPLANLTDHASEIERLKKKMSKIETDIAFLSGKLKNEKYVRQAPEHLVEKDREKLQKAQQDHEKLDLSLKLLEKQS